MNYYLDTEFLEGSQDKSFLGIKYGETKPTIDLISIGISSEDDRKYYAISKDFNIKEAWNRFQVIDSDCNGKEREYWIRKNVLKPIYKELHDKENLHAKQTLHRTNVYIEETNFNFTYRNLKKLIYKYGKTNKQIAEEIKDFVSQKQLLYTRLMDNLYGFTTETLRTFEGRMACIEHNWGTPKFYAYYADYDWVVFCQLFGTMMDLPRKFPMYCIDLKQELDRFDLKNKAKQLPKQENEHNALADAIWTKQLHEFINKL